MTHVHCCDEVDPSTVCPDPNAHEAEARSTPAEPFDEAQAWADEAARNGDPEALTDA